MEDKMRADLKVLKDHLEAKRAVLREVIQGAKEIETQRNIIKQVLQVTPINQSQPIDVNVRLEYSHCLEEFSCFGFSVRNEAHRERVLTVQMIPAASVTWCLSTSELKEITSVGSLATCHLCVAIPSHSLIGSDRRFVIIDFRSIDNPLVGDVQKPDTVVVEIFPCTKYYTIGDIQNATTSEVSLLIRSLSVSFAKSSLPHLSISQFRTLFSQFEVVDFASFQVLYGSGEWAGLVVMSRKGSGSKLSTSFARNIELLQSFLRILRLKFPIEYEDK